MLNRNAQYQEWLLPYLEDGLDEARRTQLEARLAADPALAAEAERLRQTLIGLHRAAARTPSPENAQVPADLWPHLRARLVLDPAPRPRPQPRAWWLAAPATAALIVAAFWLPGWHTPTLPELSTPSPVRQKAAPVNAVPAPPLVPTAAAPGRPKATGKPQPSVSPKVGGPKPAPAPVASTRSDPFALPAPAMPAQTSRAQTSKTLPPTPAVSTSAAKPVLQAVRPAAPSLSVAPLPMAPDLSRNMPSHGRVALSPPLRTAPPSAASPPAVKTAEPGAPPPPAPVQTAAGMGGAAAFGGGGAGPLTAASPKPSVNGGEAVPGQQAKSAAKLLSRTPAAILGQADQPTQSVRRNRSVPHPAVRAGDGTLQAFASGSQAGIDTWQASLSAAETAPLWGATEGEQQANQALLAAQESGMLDDLRARLEARRAQGPQDVVTGRALAAVYAFGFSKEAALRERRRVSALEGASGEDWFALAQAEERAGNGSAARAAYRHALESPSPPSAPHAAIARTRS